MPGMNNMAHSPSNTERSMNKDLEYDGKVTLQVPKSLYRKLTDLARMENVPLEQFLLYKLTEMAEQVQT